MTNVNAVNLTNASAVQPNKVEPKAQTEENASIMDDLSTDSARQEKFQQNEFETERKAQEAKPKTAKEIHAAILEEHKKQEKAQQEENLKIVEELTEIDRKLMNGEDLEGAVRQHSEAGVYYYDVDGDGKYDYKTKSDGSMLDEYIYSEIIKLGDDMSSDKDDTVIARTKEAPDGLNKEVDLDLDGEYNDATIENALPEKTKAKQQEKEIKKELEELTKIEGREISKEEEYVFQGKIESGEATEIFSKKTGVWPFQNTVTIYDTDGDGIADTRVTSSSNGRQKRCEKIEPENK